MKSACQWEQRQGTACFRKQTANTARWIFHCRAVLMRGSRGVLPRDCIVILFHLQQLYRGKPPRAWPWFLPACLGQRWWGLPGIHWENSGPPSAFSLLYERMSDNALRYTFDSEATPPKLNMQLMPASINVLPVQFHNFLERIKNKNKWKVQSKVNDI